MSDWDKDAITQWIAETSELLITYVDETHRSYLPLYLGRADARHALGEPPESVLREIWMASRSYASNGDVVLSKWPHHQVRRRRLLPLECALVAGDSQVFGAVERVYGYEIMNLMARVEPDAMTQEIRALSDFFHDARVDSPVDLAGTLAVLYWLTLSAVAAGEVEQLQTCWQVAETVLDAHEHLAEGAGGGLGRMMCVHLALQAIRRKNADAVATAIATHHEFFTEALSLSLATDDAALKTGAGALDITALCLLTLAASLGVDCGSALTTVENASHLGDLLAYAGALGHTQPHEGDSP